MKQLLFYGVFLFSISTFAQSEKKVTAQIKQVTVFLQQAQIEANVKTSIPQGTSKIIIEEVAGTTDVNSIKIGGKGDFTILGIQYLPNLKSKRSTQLQDSLSYYASEVATLEMLLNVASEEQTMITKNVSDIKSNQDGLVPEDFKEMIDFTRTKLTEVGTRKILITKQLAEAKANKDRIGNLIQLNGGDSQRVSNILVTVSAKQPTSIDLSLSYLATNCGWSPAYDIRVKNQNEPVTLNYKANVYQRTGVDWKNVNLTLSTTDPTANSVKPEIYPQYLSIFEPRQIMLKSARSENEMAAVAMEAPTAAGDADFAQMMPVQMVDNSLAVNFNLTMPYTINSTGLAELVEIQTYQLPVEFAYQIVPKLDTYGFLVAKIKDWEKLNLLSGNANVYFEGTFVGQTFINQNVKDDLTVSLGKDKKIIAERTEILDFKSRKTVGSNIRESFGYKTVIRNTKNEAIKLTVEDQYPVSQDSRIEVEVEEIKDATIEKETGKVKWEINLQPNQTAELFLKYNVKYPKDKQISNL